MNKLKLFMVTSFMVTSVFADIKGVVCLYSGKGEITQAQCTISTSVDETGMKIYVNTENMMFDYSISDLDVISEIGKKAINWTNIVKNNPKVSVNKPLHGHTITVKSKIFGTTLPGMFSFVYEGSEQPSIILTLDAGNNNYIFIKVNPEDSGEFERVLMSVKVEQAKFLEVAEKADTLFK